MTDATGTADRRWQYYVDAGTWNQGLLARYTDRQVTPLKELKVLDVTWAQDAGYNPYMSSVVTTIGPNTPSSKQSKVQQIIDDKRNLLQRKVYDWGNLSTATRTYDYYYLNDSNYTSRYIRNLIRRDA